MDHQQLPNGLYVPLLPKREWDTEHTLGSGPTYTSIDACKIIGYMWTQYASEVEVVLCHVVDLCDEVEIEFVSEGYRLFELFGAGPARPSLKPEQSQEPDRLLRRMWHKWAAHIEYLYTDLTNTIGRSVRCEKEHPGEPPHAGDRNCASRLWSRGSYGSPMNSWVPLRALLENDGARYGRSPCIEDLEIVSGEGGAWTGEEPRISSTQMIDLAATMKNLGFKEDGSPPAMKGLAVLMNRLGVEQDA